MSTILGSLEVMLKTGGITIAKMIVLAIGGSMLINLLCKALARLVSHIRGIDMGAAEFVIAILRLVLYVALVLGVAELLGLDTEALLSQVGVMMAALALALKDDVASLANGMMLVVTKPFEAGDSVKVAGISGTVRAISLFSTEILTYDNEMVRIPNASVVNGVIYNYTRMPTRRIEIKVGVAYGSDLEMVKKSIHDAISQNTYILKTPAPTVFMSSMDDSSLQYTARIYCSKENFGSAKTSINEMIYQELTKNSVSIPFPQLDVHICTEDKEPTDVGVHIN